KSADPRKRIAINKIRFRRVFRLENGLRQTIARAISVFGRELYQLMYKLHLFTTTRIRDLKTVNAISLRSQQGH
ncbi:MAG: hypothetical protein ACLQIJ_17655, partial [Polyangia bacterium]